MDDGVVVLSKKRGGCDTGGIGVIQLFSSRNYFGLGRRVKGNRSTTSKYRLGNKLARSTTSIAEGLIRTVQILNASRKAKTALSCEEQYITLSPLPPPSPNPSPKTDTRLWLVGRSASPKLRAMLAKPSQTKLSKTKPHQTKPNHVHHQSTNQSTPCGRHGRW